MTIFSAVKTALLYNSGINSISSLNVTMQMKF